MDVKDCNARALKIMSARLFQSFIVQGRMLFLKDYFYGKGPK